MDKRYNWVILDGFPLLFMHSVDSISAEFGS